MFTPSSAREPCTMNRSTSCARLCSAASRTTACATVLAIVVATPPGALNRRSTSTAVNGSPTGPLRTGGGTLITTGNTETCA